MAIIQIEGIFILRTQGTILQTYIQPHIDYCSTIWGGTSEYNLNRIYKLQKRAVKIIINYQYDNIANSMDELKILNIYERIFLRKAKFMFKVLNLSYPYM